METMLDDGDLGDNGWPKFSVAVQQLKMLTAMSVWAECLEWLRYLLSLLVLNMCEQ